MAGEELLVLLPDCALNIAEQTADRLRLQIEFSNVTVGQSVTASFGVASTPETTARPGDLIAVADAALYQARSSDVTELRLRQGRRLGHLMSPSSRRFNTSRVDADF